MDRHEIERPLRLFAEEPTDAHFELLFQASSSLVYTICLRILRSEEDAADAFQATYERVISGIVSGVERPPETCLATWMGLMARREADRVRKKRNRRVERERSALMARKSDPLARATENEIREIVHREIGNLPEKLRTVVELHCLNGVSQTDLAQIFEMSQSTMSRRVEKGLRLLGKRLRRAGLSETSLALAALGGSALIAAPSSASASVLGSTRRVFSAKGALALAPSTSSLAWFTLGGVLVKTKLLIGSAIGVLILAAVLFILLHKRAPTPPATGTATVAIVAPPRVPGAKPSTPPESNGSVATSQKPEANPPEPQMRATDGASLAGAPTPAPGDRVLMGTVTRSDTGEALADALVTAGREMPGVTVKQGKTNVAGLYLIEGLAGERIEVTASHPGFMAMEAEVAMSDELPETRNDFVLSPTGAVELLVVDAQGLPVPAVAVMGNGVKQYNASYPMGETDAKGMLRMEDIPLRGAEFILRKPGYRQTSGTPTFDRGAAIATLTITM